ncbi:MAG TPA: hypothetical protein VE733_10920 [Streptosporangiaceae bacterium]|nr:hypothetical protein [Streptosporangiaceae bacterium]
MLGGLGLRLGSVAESINEQGDHAFVTGVVHAGRRAQAGHRAQQFQGIDVTADLPGGGRGGEQRSEG